jgi:hypothetical protein
VIRCKQGAVAIQVIFFKFSIRAELCCFFAEESSASATAPLGGAPQAEGQDNKEQIRPERRKKRKTKK